MRSLSVAAIIIGTATGALVVALSALATWGILLLIDFKTAEGPALMVGVIVGFLGAGYGAGRLTRPSAPHGMLAGLLLALIVGAVSIVSGSRPSPFTVVILVLLSAALGRLGGVVAGRQ